MRRLHLVALVALAGSCGGTAANTAPPRLTAKDIVKTASPAIVVIEAGKDKLGTGFILDRAGLVATNLHVVAGESAIRVKLLDGTQYQVLQIVGFDPNRDLALLKIAPGKALPVLKLGDSDAVSAGDQIVAIGNPLGFQYSVTSGLISQVRPVCGRQDVEAQNCKEELTVLQISAAISPGSSGGPLFNQAGEVVGVTTAIITAGQNINLAVPGNYLKTLVQQQIAIPLDQFAKETKIGNPEPEDGIRIVRHVPFHQVTVFDGCKYNDISQVVREIGEAIDNGAPLYNDGKHEACFRIYEGTAVKFQHDGACSGVRDAFNAGLVQAGKLKTYKEKAWAMRDTFDGLLDAAHRWADQNPQALPADPADPSSPAQPSSPTPDKQGTPAKRDGAPAKPR